MNDPLRTPSSVFIGFIYRFKMFNYVTTTGIITDIEDCTHGFYKDWVTGNCEACDDTCLYGCERGLIEPDDSCRCFYRRAPSCTGFSQNDSGPLEIIHFLFVNMYIPAAVQVNVDSSNSWAVQVDMDSSNSRAVPIYGIDSDDTTADTHDPYPSKDRGYYFNSNSCIQLPPNTIA